MPARLNLPRALLIGLVSPLIATLLGLTLSAAPAAAETDEPTVEEPISEVLPATAPALMIGDSITYQSSDDVHRWRPDWILDGVPGRKVDTLDNLLGARTGLGERYPVAVLALGTNSVPGWRKADYVAAIDLLPADTQKVLVTPYVSKREPIRAYRARVYARMMREIAAARDDVTVVDWRARVSTRPWLLADGVHPNARGQRVFSRMVIYGVAAATGAN